MTSEQKGKGSRNTPKLHTNSRYFLDKGGQNIEKSRRCHKWKSPELAMGRVSERAGGHQVLLIR